VAAGEMRANMIVGIQGQLREVSEEAAIVERDGLAYEILVPNYAVGELSAIKGEQITFHTLQYLEGSAGGGNMTPRLIGFLHAEDRAFFKQFLTVKGMGARKGLRAFATPVARIATAIESGDAPELTRLPGIGLRMAEQIIAQLKGKVGAYAYAAQGVPSASKHDFTADQRDPIEIIYAWGDARADAQRWVARAAQLHEGLGGPEDWVRAAYRIKSGAEA